MSVVYKYKAIDQRGKIINDNIEADNLLDLEQRLSAMGMDLINYREFKSGIFSFKSKGITRHELINFTFQMQQLTGAGVSILDGLTDLKESISEGRLKQVISGIIDEIQGGKTFSGALSEFPEIFDNVYITLIRVGEESGHMPKVLHDLAETLKWHDEIIAHTKKIMIYPAIVTLVIIATVSYLMIALVPNLIPFIQDLGGHIPLHTQALIVTSNFLINYWYLVFTLPVIFAIILQQLYRKKPEVRYFIDKQKLKFYIFGPLLLKTDLARFSNYLALMYSSGLTVLDSLKISELLVKNSVISNSITHVHELIGEGKQISDSFSQAEIFPPLVIRMIKVGENTGALDEALLNVSYFYNREIRESIDKMEAAITPVLTILLGLIMLWIMSSVLGPIYDTLTKIQL